MLFLDGYLSKIVDRVFLYYLSWVLYLFHIVGKQKSITLPVKCEMQKERKYHLKSSFIHFLLLLPLLTNQIL